MRMTQTSRAPTDRPVGFSENWARAEAAASAPHRDGRHPSRTHQWLAAAVGVSAVLIGCMAQQRLSGAAGEARRGAPSETQAAIRAGADRPHQAVASGLSAGYVDLAFAAFERDAYALAQFYARRSMAAGDLASVALDPERGAEAAAARGKLIALLAVAPDSAAPAPLAEAQRHLDCWLREALPGGAAARSARCREAAEKALQALLGREAPRGAGGAQAQAGGSLSPQAAAAKRRELAALLERWSPGLKAAMRADIDPATLAGPVAARLRATDETLVVRPETALAGADVETEDLRRTAAEGDPAAETAVGDAGLRTTALALTAPGLSGAAAGAATPRSTLLLFDSGSATVDADALEAAMARLALRRADWERRRLLLSGHADSAGDAAANLALSRQRAEATAAALRVRLGTEAARIEIRAYGETRPLIRTADGAAEPRNRRVEIALL